MTLETAQLLCSPFLPHHFPPYKRTHLNHPCAIWVRESRSNFRWLCQHGSALAREYTYRYGKMHKSQAVIEWCRDHESCLLFTKTDQTPVTQAMPDQYKTLDPVEAYRAYYRGSKIKFARWTKREKPSWWNRNVTTEELFDICRLLLEDEGYQVVANPFNSRQIDIERVVNGGPLGRFYVTQDTEDPDTFEVQCCCLGMPGSRGTLDTVIDSLEDIRKHCCSLYP